MDDAKEFGQNKVALIPQLQVLSAIHALKGTVLRQWARAPRVKVAYGEVSLSLADGSVTVSFLEIRSKRLCVRTLLGLSKAALAELLGCNRIPCLKSVTIRGSYVGNDYARASPPLS